MRVVLGFRLYMMRFGMARLAASFARPRQRTSDGEIRARVSGLLTQKVPLEVDFQRDFEQYLSGKPGSPRYTPLRRALDEDKAIEPEQQDVWLADPERRSAVGALTKNYFDDPLALAHILGLLGPNGNYLLSRGKLSALDPEETNPFNLPLRQRYLLAYWLLDVDGDFLWALLREMQQGEDEITVENRVPLLVGVIERLLEARHLRSRSSEDLRTLERLRELNRITARNQREGLNLGQPWSWFLIPRLELLVDAGLLDKRQPDQLSGYRLSRPGLALQELAGTEGDGTLLLRVLSSCYSGSTAETPVPWEDLRSALEHVAGELRNPAGYAPLYESAVAVAVDRLERAEQPWEVPELIQTVKQASKEEAKIIFGTDRRGNAVNFKIK